MNNEEKDTRNEKINYMLQMGAQIAGGAVGSALGLISLNPVLTIALGGAGAAIGKGLADAVDKQLSLKEKARTGGAAAVSLVSINEKIEQGLALRKDEFFDTDGQNRSACEEIFEGMLLSAKNEHEEKKIKYLANIFSNTVFMNITVGEANHLLKIANDLTFRQLCVLSLVIQKESISQISLGKRYLPEHQEEHLLSKNQIFLREEVMDLYHKGLIYVEFKNDSLALLDCYNIIPDNMRLTELGSVCYSMMELESIPEKDLIEVGELLKI